MLVPRIKVVLGQVEDTDAQVIIRAGRRAGAVGRVVTVAAPAWRPNGATARDLPAAYRHAVAAANERHASSMALPAILARGPWPLDEVTRVALTVLKSTPTTVREVSIVVGTPGMLEVWAEALIRDG